MATKARRPTAHRNGAGDLIERPRYGRAAVLTLAAAGLVVGVLAALPASSTVSRRPPASHPATGTGTTAGATTTTAPAAASTGSAIHVVVLAPAGAPEAPTVRQRLTAAHYDLVSHAAIPASWVSSLTSSLVRYPAGMSAEAADVARTLGVSASSVSAEPAGTSDGSDVIEVFVPSS